MHWISTPYTWLLLTSAVIAAAVLLVAWERRHLPGLRAFLILCLLGILWPVSNLQEVCSQHLVDALFWANMAYFAYAVIPVAYLALALDYAGRGRWLTRGRLAVLMVVPVITILLAWTSDSLGMIRRHAHLVRAADGTTEIIKQYGLWFWVHTAYSYTLLVICIIILLTMLRRTASFYRGQSVALLAGMLFPWAWNLVYLLKLGPLPHYDLSPLALSMSGIALAIGLFRYRFLDLIPVARERVIENMSDGMLVLDAQQQVVDVNPAAARRLGLPVAAILGQPITTLLPEWTEWTSTRKMTELFALEVSLGDGETQADFELRIAPFTHRRGVVIGQLVLMRDISERKRAEAFLRHMAYHDPLTDLPNRELFARRLAQELAHARRKGESLVVMLLDLDGFKRINDTVGHAVGDQVLCEAAIRLKNVVREDDTVARLGGDEFTVLQTDINSLDDAVQLAHRIIESFATPMHVDAYTFQLSISIGISLPAREDTPPETLMREADYAMYLAKQLGKNTYKVYDEACARCPSPVG